MKLWRSLSVSEVRSWGGWLKADLAPGAIVWLYSSHPNEGGFVRATIGKKSGGTAVLIPYNALIPYEDDDE